MQDFLMENIAVIVALFGFCISGFFTLIGVAIGGLITHMNQSSLFEQQRKWDLDNQRRESKRSQLSNLAENLNEYVTNEITKLNTYRSSRMFPSRDRSTIDLMNEYTRISNEKHAQMMAELDFSIDPELFNLWNSDWQDAFNKLIQAYGPGINDEQVNEAVVSASAINKMLQHRINELKEETYDYMYFKK